jgi:hypothetical protein
MGRACGGKPVFRSDMQATMVMTNRNSKNLNRFIGFSDGSGGAAGRLCHCGSWAGVNCSATFLIAPVTLSDIPRLASVSRRKVIRAMAG